MSVIKSVIESDEINAYARVLLTAGTPSLVESKGVTSITDRNVGRYTLNLVTLPSANYCVGGTVQTNGRLLWQDTSAIAQTTTACPLAVYSTAAAYGDNSFSAIITGA